MPTKSVSKIITRDPKRLGPSNPPGEMLLEEFLKPMGIGAMYDLVTGAVEFVG